MKYIIRHNNGNVYCNGGQFLPPNHVVIQIFDTEKEAQERLDWLAEDRKAFAPTLKDELYVTTYEAQR